MKGTAQSLKGRIALVTGASSGIGEAVVRRLAAAGAAVIVNYRSQPGAAKKIVAEIKSASGQAIAIRADVSKVSEMALELAEKKVRVNNVAPGAIATPINEAWLHDPAKRKRVLALIPSRRIGQSEEVAGAVIYLASDAAAYVTGTTLFIDGGMTLYSSFLEQG